MLRILKVIRKNLGQARATVRLPGSVPAPAEFRGPVQINPARCLACGICSYVCVSNAIAGKNEEKDYLWEYNPGRCTFCARCVDHCTGHALTMGSKPARVYSTPGELNVLLLILFPLCSDCGAPTRPLTEELLRLSFEEPDGNTQDLLHLCERCRRRRLQRHMVATAFEQSRDNRGAGVSEQKEAGR